MSGKFANLKRFGRLKKNSAHDECVIRKIVVRVLRTSCNTIRHCLAAKGTNISLRTISRRLV